MNDSFQARRKTINDLIAGKAKEAERAVDPKRRAAIMVEVDQAIAKSCGAFDKKVQASITAFCKADTEMEKAAETGKWTWLCETAWNVGCIVWDGMKTVGEVQDGNVMGALKKLLDVTIAIGELAAEQGDAWRGVDEQEKRLVAALDAIRRLKKGEVVGQSLIDKAEMALAPLGPKIDVMERGVRKLAGSLDELLKQQDSGVLKGDEELAKLEKLVGAAVADVAGIGAAVGARRDLQKRAKDTIRTAAAKAKTDPGSFLGWALEQYKRYNTVMDAKDLAQDIKDVEKCADNMRTVVELAMKAKAVLGR